MSEFDLSSKMPYGVAKEEDLKEFIRRLKEKNMERAMEGTCLRNSDFRKLAGEKLI